MAETDTHREQMVDLIQALQRHYRTRDDVYVSGNLLFYYVQGDKRKHISPDVMVVFGIPKGKRDYYLLWREGRPPNVVIEITSSSTRHEDMVRKKRLYLEMGVREYFIFDPFRDYLKAQLRGWRQIDGQWVPMLRNHTYSAELDMDLRIRDNELRLRDVKTGAWLETHADIEHQADAALADADAARADADAARADADAARADADAARARAIAAEQRAAELERELVRLRTQR
jgi:Uma2 family endonuclease